MSSAGGSGRDEARDLRGLRVAILGSIAYPTPPPGYGPWEQMAANLSEGLLARGLDVTLFASGDSTTSARLRSVVPVSLSGDRGLDDEVYSALHAASCFEHASDYDLIHNNFDWKPLTYALATESPPLVTTIHGFSRPPILAAYYAGAERSFYCSISDSDRDPGLEYLATTYNGIDPDDFTFEAAPGEYLVFLGRFHPEKGAHLAIEIARRANLPIVLAGIPQDEAYFRDRILPEIDDDRVRFVGPVRRAERDALLRDALALVHFTTRPERFGLTLVEAMACGTPVLGARMGSIPEIVVDGETGFLCEDLDEAVARARDLHTLDRRACRRRVEREFTIGRMIDRYVDAYRRALQLGTPSAPSDERLIWRSHDWWDRPMAFTDYPPRPHSIPMPTSE